MKKKKKKKKKKEGMHTAKFKGLCISTFARCLPAQTYVQIFNYDRYHHVRVHDKINVFFYFKNFERINSKTRNFTGNLQYLYKADVE
jgi:hypothetical protein